MERITLLGSSSGRNAGDAALLAGIMDAVDAATGRPLTYEIPTIRPGFIRNGYRNRTVPVSMLPWSGSLKMLGVPTYRSVASSDVSLVFDAILFDRALWNPLFNYLSTIAFLLPHAKKRGKKLGFYNVGVGPIDTRRGLSMLRDVAEAMDFITVRDKQSLALLREAGVTNPRVVLGADAALTLRPSDDARVDAVMAELGFSPGEEILALNVSKYIDTWVRPKRPSMGADRFVEVYSRAVSRFVREKRVPVMYVSTQHHDEPLTRRLMEALPSGTKHALFSNVRYDHYDVKGVLGRVSLLFGMRLHATILASASLTPVLGLGHQPKVAHYFELLGMRDLDMSFDRFSEESLYAHLSAGWERRAASKRLLAERMPLLRREALKAAELTYALGTGGDLDAVVARYAPETAARAAGVAP